MNLSRPLQSLHFQIDPLLFLNIEHMFHGDNSETFNMYVEVDYCILCGYIWKGRSYLYSLAMNVAQPLFIESLFILGRLNKHACVWPDVCDVYESY